MRPLRTRLPRIIAEIHISRERERLLVKPMLQQWTRQYLAKGVWYRAGPTVTPRAVLFLAKVREGGRQGVRVMVNPNPNPNPNRQERKNLVKCTRPKWSSP